MAGLEQLIYQGRKNRYLRGNYSDIWDDWLHDPSQVPDTIAGRINTFNEELRAASQGSILIDLGSSYPEKEYLHFLGQLKLAKYVMVDLHLGLLAPPDDPVVIPGAEIETIAAVDMLEYVTGLPDNTANFILNGIDTDSIPIASYHNALARAVFQKTKVNGLVFSSHSSIAEEFYWDKEIAARVKRVDWHTDKVNPFLLSVSSHIFKKLS